MLKRKHSPEEITAKLNAADVLIARGATTAEAAFRIGVTPATYFRWRKQYRGLGADQVRRLKRLEAENARMRKAIIELDFAAALSM